MSILNTLIKKELVDAIRDKRSVMAGLWYALGSPIMVCGLFMILINQMSSPDDLKIEIQNPSNAPDLIRYLNSADISHSDDVDDRKDITLIIDPSYAENMAKGIPATVIVVADNSEQKLQQSIRRLKRHLQRYSSEMGSLRLIARGINPAVVQPLSIQEHDQATPSTKGSFLLRMVIMMMIYSVFIGGMNLAIDTSAGERERNSLALLLSHPLSTGQIILSKVAGVSIFGMGALLLNMVVSKFVYPMIPWEEMGFSITISLEFILLMVLVALPVAIMAASIQLFVSFLSKSFKEAQTYITLVLIVPMMLSMAASYNIAPEVMQWLPVSGQQQALASFIKGKGLPMTQLLASTAATLAIAGSLIWGMKKSLRSEKIIFGL
ncbi:ABC transporter permease [Parashewanella spongiae]|uniref:ABC transporter permease n=1 Tax=Parashewanella spongiae TaxID=342950 RepID=A0A3A6TPL5_9GAMM|nr:ABC transporter permease [Parashewanella spongiae]MCL1078497.1 ABC transporter permease subunit [Parashewanella spongiae]RJY14710.1 ABC transporter permease [Parashewanella spongiae]